jgi:ATPase
MRIVPDASVIINGGIMKLIERGEFEGADIIIPEAVIYDLERLANLGDESGLDGLEEMARLQEMKEEGKVKIKFLGDRPSDVEEVNALVREVADETKATLFTSNKVQFLAAKAKGIKVVYMKEKKNKLDQNERNQK